MRHPQLSILMASARPLDAANLFNRLNALVGQRPVEIITIIDNKKRSIGAKCNDLLAMARGKYLTFVDDDDAVSDDYIAAILDSIAMNDGVDVINFHVRCHLFSLNGRFQEGVVTPSLTNPNEEFHEGTVLRKPMQVAVWRSELAKQSQWADSNYFADTHWAEPLWKAAKTQAFIPRELYTYTWIESKSEARPA